MHLSLPAQVVGSAVACTFDYGSSQISSRDFDAGLPFATHKCHSTVLRRQEPIDLIHLAEGRTHDMAGAANAGGEGTGATSDRYRPGYELVAEQLLNYIAQENLLPGDRLPTEQGLAEILGATRNVTREAV